MKLITLTVVSIIMLSLTSFGQTIKESEVPKEVKNAFAKKYPSVKKVKWEKENTDFEASFELKEVDHSVLLSKEGIILETEMEISEKELPKNIMESFRKNHLKEKITEIAKITTNKGVVKYEIEIKGKDFLYDASGKLIQ
ncbi:MAG: PepSY-like domain-containing protein [Flavobacteriia bacterium]|nr:PepSY-like domain-containing protein [Flavobacteriia bacterium]